MSGTRKELSDWMMADVSSFTADALKERENGDDDDEEGGGVENRPSYRETEVQFRNIEAVSPPKASDP